MTKKHGFIIINRIILFAFILALVGMGLHFGTEWFKPNNPTELTMLDTLGFKKITLRKDGSISAEKERGKIVVTLKGSCLDNNPLFQNTDGSDLIHLITLEVVNLFDRSVTIQEHHVKSKIHGNEIFGYVQSGDSIYIIKPSGRATIEFSSTVFTPQIREHIDAYYAKNAATEEIVLITDEGQLPPLSVTKLSEPCSTENKQDM